MPIASVGIDGGKTTFHLVALGERNQVTLTRIRNDKEQVFIQLCAAPEGFPKQANNAYKFVAVEASKQVNGVGTTTFSDLAPGTNALSALQDESTNGKMDTNAFGIPKEGWAVP